MKIKKARIYSRALFNALWTITDDIEKIDNTISFIEANRENSIMSLLDKEEYSHILNRYKNIAHALRENAKKISNIACLF